MMALRNIGKHWKWKTLVFLYLFIGLLCTGVHGQCPSGFTDIDPGDAFRCVAATAGTQTSLPSARLTCQQMGRAAGVDADLMRVESSDLTNIASVSGFDAAVSYWVGLTDASVPTAPEWVIDCTAYNGAMQPFLDDVPPCTGLVCNCYIYDHGETNLKETNCIGSTARRSLCAISQEDDFPEIICPQNYMPIKDRCYRFYTGLSPGLNFDDARARCMAESAELARANQYDCNFAEIFDRATAASANELFLIGLMQEGDNLLWRDGTGATFAENDAGSGNCFAIDTSDNTGTFNRQECTILSANIICEQDARQPTTPGFATTPGDATTAGAFESTAGVDATTPGADVSTPGADVTTPGADVTTDVDRDVTTQVVDDTTVVDFTTRDGATTPGAADQTTDRGLCCPEGSELVDDQCYAVITGEAVTYNNAVSGCETLGGALARVDPDVQQFLVDYFTANSAAESIWIGLLRSQEQGTDVFRWFNDNTELIESQAFWADGQPSGPTGIDCVYSLNVPTNLGNWFLSNCFTAFDYICQFDLTEDCFDTPCNPNPCNTSGGPITCSSPGFGQSVCTCGTGYEMEAGSTVGPCIDINECLNFPCDEATQDCTNTVGSFSCDCRTGLRVNPADPDGPCISIDVCENVNCDTSGPQGAEGIFCNADGNCECTDSVGYTLQNANGPCININECGLDICDTDSTSCVDTTGSFMCNCRDGFEPITGDNTRCSAIVDPCDPNPCAQGEFNNIICNAATGACSCPSGYELSGGSSTGPCVDINECTRGTDNCVDASTTCVNTVGSFMCQCRSGYENLQSGTFCSDINECTRQTDNCDDTTTTCFNIVGSFGCQCRSGFENLQGNFCSDINECTTFTDTCDDTSTLCVNSVGSFTCQCRTGYVRLDSNTCQDLCTAGQSSCDLTTTTCTFNSGVVTCTCLDGFEAIEGNANACQAVEETVCCPDTSSNNRLYLTTGGTCVFFPPNTDNFATFRDTLCSEAATGIGASGGQLLDLSDEALPDELDGFVTGLSAITNIFPSIVWVGFSRANENSDFTWLDGTVIAADDPDWTTNQPQEPTGTEQLNCGSVRDPSNVFGYANVDCTTNAFAFCSVSTVTSCSAALTARALLPFSSMTFLPEMNDENSEAYMSTMNMVEEMCQLLPDSTVCVLSALTEGSVIAHVEVTVRKPHRIRTIEMLETAIRDLGTVDQDGFLTITLSTGETVILDTNRLDIDDLNNHLCLPNTCQNNGTCIFDERLIEANCQCMEGFEGDRCQAVKGEASTGLIVALAAVVMVVMVLVFASCFCCFCILSKNQKKNKMVYQYRPPTTEVFAPPRGASDRRVVVNRLATAAGVNDRVRRPASIPQVVRNRGLSHDTEMDTYSNPSLELDHDDVESSVDQKRLSHFERVFYNAAELNSRMSQRGDTASVLSHATSSNSSVYKPPISESMESINETREFNTPYTADGTENI